MAIHVISCHIEKGVKIMETIEYDIGGAQAFLAKKGQPVSQGHLRRLVGNGKLKSRKLFSSRLIAIDELKRFHKEWKARTK